MAKKYYDYLKPKAQQPSFSDTVNQQIMLLEAQQQQQSAAQLKSMKDRQKTIASQEGELLGFETDNLSDVHKEAFNNKLLHTRAKINGFYYTGVNQGQFFEDIMSLKELHSTFKNHYSNVKSEREALEGWVTGTKDWTDKDNELKDDMSTLEAKNKMWNSSGVDIESIEYNPITGDAYAYYTDINGNRLKGDNGEDMYGLISESPTLGSKSFYSPTASPYANLLPGAFSKNFSSSLGRLEGSLEEKTATLRNWVTEEAKNNPNVVATALNTFKDNYGENVYQSILNNDKLEFGEEEGYIPMDLREYIDETMKFLTGKLEGDSDDDDSDKIFPSSVQFNIDDFPQIADQLVGPVGGGFGFHPDLEEGYGEGITALMVPKTGIGKSGLMVESVYQPLDDLDPRANEVSDQYRVLGVAMDENRNLFVRAEMYVEEDISNLDPARLAALANIQGVDINAEAKTARTKVMRNFVVKALTPEGDQNQEYLSILGQIGYAAGVTEGEKAVALGKGIEILRNFNDEQAQLIASGGAINSQAPEDDPNQQLMLDMQFMNTINPILVERHGEEAAEIELSALLDYIKQFPNEREEILKNAMNGKIPYISSMGNLLYEDQQ